MSCCQYLVHVSVNIFQGHIDERSHLEEGGRHQNRNDVFRLERRSFANVFVSVRIQVPITCSVTSFAYCFNNYCLIFTVFKAITEIFFLVSEKICSKLIIFIPDNQFFGLLICPYKTVEINKQSPLKQ